ncbi:MAG TPA: TRAM domain-containing protein [Nitrososphaeraceae archaeon]|nr:TRAM domain-containing protein [Nitrososphaeraceae archaeon]
MSYSYVNLFWTDKCGYANCPVCKNAITNSEYWDHIRLHPGHESDSPLTSRTSFGNIQQNKSRSIRYEVGSRSNSSSKSFNRDSADATQLRVGKEYQVDITEIGRHGDGIAKIQDYMIFVKGGRIGEQVKIIITKTGSRFAMARII